MMHSCTITFTFGIVLLSLCMVIETGAPFKRLLLINQNESLFRNKRQLPQVVVVPRSNLEMITEALNQGIPIQLDNFTTIDAEDISNVIGRLLFQLNETAFQIQDLRPILPQLRSSSNRNNAIMLTPPPLSTSTSTTTTTTTLPPPATSTSMPPNRVFVGTGQRIRTMSTSFDSPRQSNRVRNQVREGRIRLVGGQSLFEGNIEINHMGRWGSICDDEWDMAEANVVCRQLGFILGALEATTNSRYGMGRRFIWMDNLFCNGSEKAIQDCPFPGWQEHDCGQNEAAGVVCRTRLDQEPDNGSGPNRSEKLNDSALIVNQRLSRIFGNEMQIRLIGERVDHSGRVEVRFNGDVNPKWQLICGNGWSMNEANVICRQLGLGSAQIELHLRWHDIQSSNRESRTPEILTGIKCNGNESNLSQCMMIGSRTNQCPDSYKNIAGVTCSADLPDLILDTYQLENSAFVEDRSIMFLQCAMEEQCLSKSAYELDRTNPEWIYEYRRLLRFTAAIRNIGTIDFRPFTPKYEWIWHSCHRHYHSMEVFAHFDLLDHSGNRIAEGHKASFCLEDNDCQEGSRARYKCANYGEQGISVGCVDIYKYDIDCQWIDITDIQPGEYILKITINPEFKVPELTFENNAASCHFIYTSIGGYVTNCTVVKP